MKELTDDDFCPACGICLPKEDRCSSSQGKKPREGETMCPHAEAYWAEIGMRNVL